MQRNMDKIQIESRREIENIMIALGQWQRDHAKDKDNDSVKECVKELYNHLDVMHMSW